MCSFYRVPEASQLFAVTELAGSGHTPDTVAAGHLVVEAAAVVDVAEHTSDNETSPV